MSDLPLRASIIDAEQLSSIISTGKHGSFQANHILGRPYHLTFEIIDEPHLTTNSSLRVVAAAELYADIVDEETSTPLELDSGKIVSRQDGAEYEVTGKDGSIILRTNRNINDDSTAQSLTMDQIEALKSEGGGSGKDLIAKLLQSHSAIDQKTAFGLAKYTLRKEKKYLRRFTVLPVDVSLLSRWIMAEKEPLKIMEMKEEIIALIGSWSNVHYTLPANVSDLGEGTMPAKGRWLVIDETGGLLVATVAEKLGFLTAHESFDNDSTSRTPLDADLDDRSPLVNGCSELQYADKAHLPNTNHEPAVNRKPAGLARTNTITLIHANAQPNISLLRYFDFDASNPSPSHPLQRHLRTISWLQLLYPEEDNGYIEPDVVATEILQTWKSGKRGNYFRKRRRWERIKSIVDETREGEFDGLLVASVMNLDTILHHTVPLLRGAAQVVIYSPTVEPLVEVADLYSTTRRAAFVRGPPDKSMLSNEDFPLNPTLLLAPSIQTARSRSWQVLPGRTHPLMTGHGGAEGYIFTATRVLPAEGKIAARGNFKRRKINDNNEMVTSDRRTEPLETN